MCVSGFLHVYMCAYVNMNVCVYVYMHICICMYVYMYIFIYVYIFTSEQHHWRVNSLQSSQPALAPLGNLSMNFMPVSLWENQLTR